MKKLKAFTLVELLVVIAIIGLLATLSVLSLNNARLKARDAKRIADVKQIMTALELYYNDQQEYPDTVTSGSAIASGTTVYMTTVPEAPTPPAANAYTYDVGADNETYTLTYTLEGPVGNIPLGAHTSSPSGLY